MDLVRRFLILLALPAALEAQETPAAVEGLLRALDDDSIEVRQKATEELERLGEEARPALVRRRSEAFSLEVRSRIGEILGRLDTAKRLKEFKGGKPVCGFSARLEVKEDPEDGTVLFKAEFMNVGPAAAGFVPIQSWNTSLPGSSSSSSHSRAQLRVKALDGEILLTHRGRCSGGSFAPPKTPVRVEAGGTRVFELRLDGDKDEFLRLKPGSYEATVVYYACSRGLLAGAEEDLESNAVRFTVKG